MTKLEFLNKFILQWFFIRLGRIRDCKIHKTKGWKILKWIVPLTGWSSDYVYLDKGKNK
jgi:hypothetical protein